MHGSRIGAAGCGVVMESMTPAGSHRKSSLASSIGSAPAMLKHMTLPYCRPARTSHARLSMVSSAPETARSHRSVIGVMGRSTVRPPRLAAYHAA